MVRPSPLPLSPFPLCCYAKIYYSVELQFSRKFFLNCGVSCHRVMHISFFFRFCGLTHFYTGAFSPLYTLFTCTREKLLQYARARARPSHPINRPASPCACYYFVISNLSNKVSSRRAVIETLRRQRKLVHWESASYQHPAAL